MNEKGLRQATERPNERGSEQVRERENSLEILEKVYLIRKLNGPKCVCSINS